MSNETTNPVTDETILEPEVREDDAPIDEPSEESNEDDSAIDDSEEVEHEGKKYKIPKELKSALMMQADYTRKTQEVAELRKAAENERDAVKRQAEVQQSDIREYAQLYSIEERLKQFEQVNWQQYSQQDPVQAQASWFEYSQLKDQGHKLATNVSQRERQREFERQQETAKQIEQGQASLAKEIKGWSPELGVKLQVFAKSEGWSDREISNITVAQVKTLHSKYLISEQLVKKQSTAPKIEAKPVTQVGGGGATSKKSPSQMTDKEFSDWRRAQIKNRN